MKKISTFIIILALLFHFPAKMTNADNSPALSVPSAILVEQETGTVLFESNADEKRAPASVTKVMTLLLIMEAIESNQIKWDTAITVSSTAAGMGGSQVYLKENETMSVDEMVKCITVVSANDCCVAMAEHLYGTVDSFVERMNERAKELGMKNTHFNSCTGLDTEDHYTTARDIALMSRELMRHREIQKYTTIWMDSVRNGAFTLSNTNRLIRYYEGATGLKTGYTAEAGYCLSATATKDDLSLIAVVLGGKTSDERFNDAKALLNHGFSQYSLYRQKPNQPNPVEVIKGLENSITTVLKTPPSFLIPKGTEGRVTYKINLPKDVMAPVEKNQKLGTIEYTLDGESLGTISLLAEKEIKRINFSHLFFQL
ncbi:MAG: D-alanyl-D-alanine carboxypeptidase, partial [Clostridia bacterium]|nr:D-alanyl-D-alanine carboxypeptidase [Clostridia bacterium]